jgi:large subunit ribosomal protein L5
MTERRSKRTTTAVEEPVAAADEATVEQPMAAESDAPASAADPMVAEPAAAELAAEPATEAEPVDAGEPLAAPTAEPVPEPGPGAEPAERTAQPRGKARAEAPDEVPASARPPGPRGLQKRYLDEAVPALAKQFEYTNANMVPRLSKIVVNIGIGEALTNAKAVDAASGDLTMITGQKPIVMKARRSIAQFKIRTGNPIGLKVTLRGQRMWDFLERLTLLALPRIRDFRGTPSRSFDGRGNYTLGLREQVAFPEIDYDKVDRLRGLEVSIVTTAKSDEESKRLLELLGMPFAS